MHLKRVEIFDVSITSAKIASNVSPTPRPAICFKMFFGFWVLVPM